MMSAGVWQELLLGAVLRSMPCEECAARACGQPVWVLMREQVQGTRGMLLAV